MTEKKKEKEQDHIDWLVEHRAATQEVSAKLFRLLKEHPDEIEYFSWETQTLVAISFSLWRSAFLSDKTGYRDDTDKSAVGFLREMLLNNAIAYSQERNTKDWTFNYYVSNARYRLEDLAQEWRELKIGPLLPPKGKQTPKNRWEFLQRAFAETVDHLEQRLRMTKK